MNNTNSQILITFGSRKTPLDNKIILKDLPDELKNNNKFQEEFNKINNIKDYIDDELDILRMDLFFNQLNKLLNKYYEKEIIFKINADEDFLITIKRNLIETITVKNIKNLFFELNNERYLFYYPNKNLKFLFLDINNLRIAGYYSSELLESFNEAVFIENINKLIVHIKDNFPHKDYKYTNMNYLFIDFNEEFVKKIKKKNIIKKEEYIFTLDIKSFDLLVEFLYKRFKNFKYLKIYLEIKKKYIFEIPYDFFSFGYYDKNTDFLVHDKADFNTYKDEIEKIIYERLYYEHCEKKRITIRKLHEKGECLDVKEPTEEECKKTINELLEKEIKKVKNEINKKEKIHLLKKKEIKQFENELTKLFNGITSKKELDDGIYKYYLKNIYKKYIHKDKFEELYYHSFDINYKNFKKREDLDIILIDFIDFSNFIKDIFGKKKKTKVIINML